MCDSKNGVAVAQRFVGAGTVGAAVRALHAADTHEGIGISLTGQRNIQRFQQSK